MAKRGRKPKSEYDDLPAEFKDEIAACSLDTLKGKLAELVKTEEANTAAKAADEDLNSLKEKLKVASEPYNEITKTNKLKLKYMISVLADKGDLMAIEIVKLKLMALGLRGM